MKAPLNGKCLKCFPFLDVLASLDFKFWVSQSFIFFTSSASTGLSELFFYFSIRLIGIYVGFMLIESGHNTLHKWGSKVAKKCLYLSFSNFWVLRGMIWGEKNLLVNKKSKVCSASCLALYDTFWKFIFSLNRAEKWFNSKFNSKQNPKYSFKKIFIQ